MTKDRELYIDKIKKDLEELSGQLAEVEVIAPNIKYDIREAMKKQALQLSSLVDEAKQRLSDAQSVSDDVWPEMRNNLEFTDKALKNSVDFFFRRVQKNMN